VGSLLEAMDAQWERTLWSASLLLKQLSFAYENLLSGLIAIGPRGAHHPAVSALAERRPVAARPPPLA